jgi:hypothetical protein
VRVEGRRIRKCKRDWAFFGRVTNSWGFDGDGALVACMCACGGSALITRMCACGVQGDEAVRAAGVVGGRRKEKEIWRGLGRRRRYGVN